MNGRRQPTGALLAVLLLAGCARSSAPVTIGQALGEVQRELGAAGAVSAVGTDPVRFAAAAHTAQCAARQADPEVPLLAHDLTLDLTGSFSATGGFTVGSAVVGLGVTGAATRGQTQEIALPLSFVALSEVPAMMAAQRLAPLATLPERDRRAETRPILAERDRLRVRIHALIASWSPASCSGMPAPAPVVFQPNTRRR
jgi:hypothetical protein